MDIKQAKSTVGMLCGLLLVLAGCRMASVGGKADADGGARASGGPVSGGGAPSDSGAPPDGGAAPDSGLLWDGGAPSDGGSDPGALTSATFTESFETFINPERGFYKFSQLLDVTDYSFVIAAGDSLAYGLVRLDNYRTVPLDSSVLAKLQAGFDAARSAGIKLVLRFAYNYDSSGVDAPLSLVQQHISQLAPVLSRNADVIAVVQAGFIGAWGEWHDSTQGLTSTSNEQAILFALVDALAPELMVQVRYPPAKASIFGTQTPLSAADAYNGTRRARVGHHNDCFLANDTDMGTYPPDAIPFWKDFVAQESLYTPVGGETCAVSSRSVCSVATAELGQLHYSFLNEDFEPNVLSSWSTGGCLASIRDHLGYRLVLEQARWTSAPQVGGSFTLSLDVANRGDAAPFASRPLYIVLSNATGIVWSAALPGLNARQFVAGATTTVSSQVQLPASLAPGTYTLSLWLPDAHASLQARPSYAIRLANQGTWDAQLGLNGLTSSFDLRP